MSDISDISCTPPEIREAANVAIQNLLPTKSRKHKVVYEKFVQWCKDKNIKNYTDYFFMFITSNSSSAFLITCSNLSNCIIIIVRII
jgi:hypothetical protein